MTFPLKPQILSTTLSEGLLYCSLSLEVAIGMIFQNAASKNMEMVLVFKTPLP